MFTLSGCARESVSVRDRIGVTIRFFELRLESVRLYEISSALKKRFLHFLRKHFFQRFGVGILLLLLLPILCRAASSAALSHTGGFRVGGGVHDSYTFQCGLVGSFTSPGIDTR